MFSIAFLVAFNVVFRPCFSIEMNVTRSLQDTFSVSNCTLCAKFNQATCLEEGVCQCPTVESTFFIYKQRCESPSSLINDQGCLPHGKNHLRPTDLTSSSSWSFHTKFSSCSVPLVRTFEYLGRQGKWMTHRLQGDRRVFAVDKKTSSRRMVLKIFGNNDLVLFAGRIIRVDLLCQGTEGEAKSCLILKAKGTISTTGIVIPSQSSVPTIQHGDHRTTQAVVTSERSNRTGTKEPTTPRIHYLGSQSKPRFTPTRSNSSVISIAHINGAVSVDKTNKKDDTVVVAVISVLGAIACVLVIGALFAWFVIKYYKGFRQQDQRNTPQSLVINNNQDIQNTIPMATMTTAGRLSEPVYSELPDVVESANRNCDPADISLPVDNQDDFFIIRNPLQYNTLPLPRGRNLTDPLPATPPGRSKTPDMRLTHRTTSTVDPNATKTAQFLTEVGKNLSVRTPVFQNLSRRKRSSTDVDSEGVFFENFTAKGLVVDLVDGGEEKPMNKSTHSVYEDLCETSKESRISVYEPLEKATLQPPYVRQTTLERINNQVCLEEDSAPEYHVLEPSPEHDTHDFSPTNDQVDLKKLDPNNKDSSGSVGADIRGPYSLPMTEHHVQEGPNKDRDQGCSNEGLEFEDETTVDKKSAQASGEILKDNQSIRLNEPKDGCSYGHSHGRGRTSEKIYLRPRSKSSEF